MFLGVSDGRLPILSVNNTETARVQETENRIAFWELKDTDVVHLVLSAFRGVAGQTQGLVGHQLPPAGVEGGADGDAAKDVSR